LKKKHQTGYLLLNIYLVNISFAIVFIVLDEVWKMLRGIFCHFVTPVTVVDRKQAGVGVVFQNGIVCVLKHKRNTTLLTVSCGCEAQFVEHLGSSSILAKIIDKNN
jgi:hypothetical protein